MSNEDPHGYIAIGAEQAKAYMSRQYWGLKWVIVVVAGLMTTTVIMTGHWIPFLNMNIFTWVMAMMCIWINTNTCRILFAHREKHVRTGNVGEVVTFDKKIQKNGWFSIFLITVVLHWVMMVGYFSFFVEITGK